jgi:DNA replication protein DnaC
MNKDLDEFLESLDKKIQERVKDWEAMPEEEKARIMAGPYTPAPVQEEDEKIAWYKKRGIPERYYNSTWDNWIADTPSKQKALSMAKKAWNKNLFFSGRNGTGKTHLGICLAKDGATYRRMSEIFREVREDFENERETIAYYGNVNLLIVDEIGRGNHSPFEKNMLFEIIDRRYNNMLPTTLISNMSTAELSTECGAAIMDRLRPIVVCFDWESHRSYT